MVLSIARPLETGPALFWTWFLLGSCLPGAALLAVVAARLRGLGDLRASSFVIIAVVGGMLARGLSLSGRQIIETALPELDHGFTGLLTDVVLNQGALILVSLMLIAAQRRGRIDIRSAMLAAGGVGAVFSSLHLMGEQFSAIAAGADTAALSVHILEHAALLTVGYPLWTSLLLGGIIRWRREPSTSALHQTVWLAVIVFVAQVVTVLLTEVVPGMLGGTATQIACVALALLMGAALSSPWRGLVSSANDARPKRLAVGRSRPSVPLSAAHQSGGA